MLTQVQRNELHRQELQRRIDALPAQAAKVLERLFADLKSVFWNRPIRMDGTSAFQMKDWLDTFLRREFPDAMRYPRIRVEILPRGVVNIPGLDADVLSLVRERDGLAVYAALNGSPGSAPEFTE